MVIKILKGSRGFLKWISQSSYVVNNRVFLFAFVRIAFVRYS